MKLESRQRSDVQETLDQLPRLLDPTLGIIRSIEWYTGEADDPDFFHCHARIDAPSRAGTRAIATGGTAARGEVALAKAIGESLERYCAFADQPPVRVASHAELDGQAVDPRLCTLFHPSQYHVPGFPFRPPSLRARLGWVEGFSLTRQEPRLVPATLTHLTYEPRTPDDAFEDCPVSGYACGRTLEEAALNGLCEVVERDAFMIFWYQWLSVPRLDLATFDAPEVTEALARYRRVPGHVTCASITTDVGIPAVLAMLTSRRRGWPAATIALAANLSVERALVHALGELAANLLLVRSSLAHGRVPHGPLEVASMEDHGLLYATPRFLGFLDPLLRPRRVVGATGFARTVSDDVGADLEECVRRLGERDLEAIVVDLTTPAVAERGFHVVKVLVPGMQPIDFSMQWPHLGGRRLYEAPERMGYRRLGRRPCDLNLFPHPFP